MAELTTGNGFPNVVVTGFAMTTALATDADSTWKGLLDGQSGIRKLEDPFVEQYDLPVRIGGHLLEDFDSELTRVELRRLSYLQKMSTVIEHAGCGRTPVHPKSTPRRLMVSIGTGMGSCRGTRVRLRRHAGQGFARRVSVGCQMYMPNGPAAAVGLERQRQGRGHHSGLGVRIGFGGHCQRLAQYRAR